MVKSKIVLHSLGHALLVLGYISLVAFFINSLQGRFPAQDQLWMPISILLLIVFSVAVMAVLVFGRPVLLFLNGDKREAIHFFAYTLGWIFLLLIIVFSIAFLMYAN